MVIFFLIILFIILWALIDFKLGRHFHIKRILKQEFPFRKSTITLFNTGQKLYDDLFQQIEKATKHVHILFYILKDDKVSEAFLELLMDKAKQGLEVRLLLDRIGSNKLSKKKMKELRENGVFFTFCHIPKFPFYFYSLNERNHRKISVIDGKVGYIGGFNIGREYIGQDPKLGDWRDYHLRIEGEGVQDLQKQFLHDWEDSTKERLHLNDLYFPPLLTGEILHKFVPTDGAYLQHIFQELIQTAKEELIIGTPYFIPGKTIFNDLIEAANRGVVVKIIVPMKADHFFVREAAFPYFKQLLEAGCKVYRYYYGFFHAKVIVKDGQICDIGTANFDKRSLYLNHEINCLIYDQPFVQLVKSTLEKDLDFAEELTLEDLKKRSLLQRGKEKISTILSKFL
ncbi:cardiolipin synthase [Bacillus sp. DJP31]|uniref:cardiolipin synthase n=1 Tax=Bacillus sp. DJP31 TaxID=3409789 RepID=UPI003BB67AD6